jgi:CysZ protein
VLIAQFIPAWLQWLDWLIYPLFFIGFFVAGFFTFTLIANLIASPFYGGLAAKTQHILVKAHLALNSERLAKGWPLLFY